MPRAWRLLLDGPGTGPRNMGVDEALLESAARDGAASLRIYSWRGPWLSLGWAQRLEAARREACLREGVGVVRRATGGGAVLHGADLTYALAAPQALLPEGLAACYALVGRALAAAVRRLGVEVEAGAASGRPARAFDCFVEPAADELSAGGRKLVGSAQRRARGAVLQHGSLRFEPDPPAARRAAGLASGSATSLRELGFAGSREDATRALVGAFAEILGAHLEPGTLAPEEEGRAAARGAETRPEGPIPLSAESQGCHRVTDR